MIIWIASYPKSGNTWVRSLISSYLYSENGIFDFKLLKKIDQFPSKGYFDFFLKDLSNLKNVSKYWIPAQDRINLHNEGPTFLKTHSALCTLENNAFTNKINTGAAIYVVRDPRNVITSFAHHYSMTPEESYEYITNKNHWITHGVENKVDETGIASILGSWSEHYKSWNNLSFAPLLVIKYEDLVSDPTKTFIKIIKFLSNIIKINVNEEKVINSVNSCSFDVLSNKEKKEGFFEAVPSKKTNEKIKFFNLGKNNNWKKLLDPKIEKKTRETFHNEMKLLNYI